jgi:hypothetical protein
MAPKNMPYSGARPKSRTPSAMQSSTSAISILRISNGRARPALAPRRRAINNFDCFIDAADSESQALPRAHRRSAAKAIAVLFTLCHERASPTISRVGNAMSCSIGIQCPS